MPLAPSTCPHDKHLEGFFRSEAMSLPVKRHMHATEAHIGTAGFSFPHWQGPFYPRTLKPAQWLAYYAQFFNSIEVNTTFYAPPRSGLLDHWLGQVPSDFSFTLKMNRAVTHEKGLRDMRQELYGFLREASTLGDRLSCILFQLPPFLQSDIPLLANALEETSQAAASLPYPPRLAWEFRHPSWNNEHVLTLLRNYGCAMVIHDMPGGSGWIVGRDAETNELFLLSHEIRVSLREWNELWHGCFSYVRFHGTVEGEERREYDAQRLRPWADGLNAMLTERLPVYGYFKNDPKGAAVRDALRLSSMIGWIYRPHDAEQSVMELPL
jgi:uncharacterized protein YecE (DUF72 family)